VARLRSERSVVQSSLVRYAEEAGWTYVTAEEALRLRRGETSPVLWYPFVDQVQKLNPGHVDNIEAEEVANRLMRVQPTIEGNFDAWEYLRGLKTVFVPREKRERNLRLLDFDDPSRNTFHVTDEFVFTNGTYRIRADVVLLVNGVPVIIFETKAATRLDGIAEALEQIRRYHREAPELLSVTQLYGLTHLLHFYYGASWNTSRNDLFNWREEAAGQDFETLVKTFVSPVRILRVLFDFILFTRRDDELTKVVLRPHQMRAVDRAIYRARDPERRRGLIWHTQGSGKTFTMITIARKLIEDPALENPTVLMLVDRNELEAQLFGNLAATVGRGDVDRTRLVVPVARSKCALQELLRKDTRGLGVSMIH